MEAEGSFRIVGTDPGRAMSIDGFAGNITTDLPMVPSVMVSVFKAVFGFDRKPVLGEPFDFQGGKVYVRALTGSQLGNQFSGYGRH